MFCTHFGHETKIKLIPSYSRGKIGSNNRTTDHSFLLRTMIRKIRLISKFDFTTWETNNCNTHIAQYLKK